MKKVTGAEFMQRRRPRSILFSKIERVPLAIRRIRCQIQLFKAERAEIDDFQALSHFFGSNKRFK